MGSTTASAAVGQSSRNVTSQGMPSNVSLCQFSTKMSSSYATGGDTVTLPSDVKGAEVIGLIVMNWSDGTRFYQWDGTAGASPKIKAMTAGNAEVASTTDLSAVTVKCLAVLTR